MADVKIPVDLSYYATTVDGGCRTWVDTRSGTQVRMSNHAAALRTVARKLNHCLAQMPRVVFSKAQPFSARPTLSSTPVYRWKFDDSVVNAREREFRVLTVATNETTDDNASHYWQRVTGASTLDTNTLGPVTYGGAGAAATQDDVWEESAVYARGTETNTEVDEGIASINDCELWEVCVQETPVRALDTGDHRFVAIGPTAGQPVLSPRAEELRSEFHQQRTTNLPIVLSWAAIVLGDTYATTSISLTSGYGASSRGIRIDSTANGGLGLVNLLDGSVASGGGRVNSLDGNDPGWPCFVQYCGRGDETNTTAGKKVKVTFRVLALDNAASGSAVVTFVGPSTFSNNYCELAVTAGAGSPAWYGSDSDYIYLDASKSYTDTSADRALIHALGTAADNLYIYGIRGWVLYG